MEEIFGNFGNLGGRGGLGRNRGRDMPLNDTAETILISPLSLLKIIKHGKAGIPIEVMGLMMGDYVDDYTVKCVDVFSMPQSGTETTIESIDEVFQVNMIEMLKQTGRNEIIIGWYHSHPGYGCFLSSTDVNTQKQFEQENPRTVAVVVDPIQSVRGKVVIDAFRTSGQMGLTLTFNTADQRQTTSNLGVIPRARNLTLKDMARIQYYNILIGYRKNELETQMLLNLKKNYWDSGFKLEDSRKQDEENLKKIEDIRKSSEKYVKWIEGEVNKSTKELYLESVGRFNPRDHLESTVEDLITENLNTCLTNMLNSLVF